MEWSELCEICFCFMAMNLTGTVGCLLYMLFQRRLEKFGLKLAGLKMVICLYLIPVVYGILCLSRIKHVSGGWARVRFMMKDIDEKYSLIYKYISLVWGIGLAIEIGMRAYQYLRFRKLMRANVPVEDGEWNSLVEECSKKYRLTAIKTYRNPYVQSALVTGVSRPIIVLPDAVYFPDEMYMIAEHELCHIHNRDLMWKQLAMLVSWLHWYNPLVYWVIRQIIAEQEINCDLSVCSGSDRYTAKEYCQFLLDLEVKQNDNKMYAASLVETKSFFVRRIQMIANRKKVKKVSKRLAVIFGLVFVMCTTLSAYAVADEVMEKQEEWIKSKEEGVDLSGESQMQTTIYEEFDDGTTAEIYVNGSANTYSSLISVGETIAANTRCLYASQVLEEESEVTISVNCSDSSVIFRIGIKNEDTNMLYYIQGTGTLSYTFSAPVAGTYRAYVENTSNSVATFTGMIFYP